MLNLVVLNCLIIKATCSIKSSVFLDQSHCGIVAEACLLTLSWLKVYKSNKTCSTMETKREALTLSLSVHRWFQSFFLSYKYGEIQTQENVMTNSSLRSGMSSVACRILPRVSFTPFHDQQSAEILKTFVSSLNLPTALFYILVQQVPILQTC